MSNNTLKLLAQKAKKRLSTAGQTISQKQTTTAYLSQSTYAIVANLQNLKEDPLYDKVKKLIERDDVFNPIAELTDHTVFDKLSQIEKERYVIDISKSVAKVHIFSIHTFATRFVLSFRDKTFKTLVSLQIRKFPHPKAS